MVEDNKIMGAEEKREEEYSKVSVIRTVRVSSTSKTGFLGKPDENFFVNLSNLDRSCKEFIDIVLFYKAPSEEQDISTAPLFDSLKSSMEKVLSLWNPASGRLITNPVSGKMDIICNDSGSVLVETVTKLKISELQDLSQYSKVHEDLVFKPEFHSNISTIPLVAVQITRFGCGGYSIGVRTSHALFDGHATYNFLCAWASVTSSGNDEILQEFQPVHDRNILRFREREDQEQSDTCRNGKLDKLDIFNHFYQLIEQRYCSLRLDFDLKSGCFKKINGINPLDFVQKTFRVDAAKIDKLKRKVLERNCDISCSSFDVLASHLWKARTKSLMLEKGRKVCLQFIVNIRKRTKPSLPDEFTGNAYVLVSVLSTVEEMEKEALEITVEKIKRAKASVTNEYVMKYMAGLEGSNGSLPPLTELTMISDWTRTPFHKVNFGHGNAVYASPLAPPYAQVAFFMQNPDEEKTIDVRIGLQVQQIQSFHHHFITEMEQI